MIVSKLLSWFEQNKRVFPWRKRFNHPDPYLILFAEVMLQRTRADQVARVYLEFIREYPDFQSLSQAPRSEVRKSLRPLGLNWRIGRILDLIEFLQRKHGGRIPSDYNELLQLPGVGPYVASAVMCYAFLEPMVAIDVNVVRVLSRIFGIPYTKNTKSSKALRELAASLIPEGKARELNLCLLDFGALVCTTNNPRCNVCPVKGQCRYFQGPHSQK